MQHQASMHRCKEASMQYQKEVAISKGKTLTKHEKSVPPFTLETHC